MSDPRQRKPTLDELYAALPPIRTIRVSRYALNHEGIETVDVQCHSIEIEGKNVLVLLEYRIDDSTATATQRTVRAFRTWEEYEDVTPRMSSTYRPGSSLLVN